MMHFYCCDQQFLYLVTVLLYGCQLTELPILVNASVALCTLVSFTDTAKECTR